MNDIDKEIQDLKKKLEDAEKRRFQQRAGSESDYIKEWFTAVGEIIADIYTNPETLNGFSYGTTELSQSIFYNKVPKAPEGSAIELCPSSITDVIEYDLNISLPDGVSW